MAVSITQLPPGSIYQGDTVTLRFSVTNSNTLAAVSSTAFTNTLTNLKVAGSATYTCSDGTGASAATSGTITATVGSSSVTLAGGVIPMAGASLLGKCDVDVPVTSYVPGAQTSTFLANSVTGNDGVALSAPAADLTQTVTVLALNPPVISKSFSSLTVVKNDQTVRLTITINNSNNTTRNLPLNTAADTPTFAIQDVLPTGLQVAGAPNIAISCPGGTNPAFTPSAGDTTLVAVGGTVAAGGACTLQVDLVGTTTNGHYNNTLTNTIDRNTEFNNLRGLVPASNASASLTINSPLRVTNSFVQNPVRAGQQATLRIRLYNDSPLNSLTGVGLTNNTIGTPGNGGNLTINSATLTGCGGATIDTSVNSSKGFTLSSGTIAASSYCQIDLTYTPTLGTAGVTEGFTNTINENDVANNEGANNNYTQTSLTVYDRLTVSKSLNSSYSVNAGNVAGGSIVKYGVTVNNYYPAALTGVHFTDSLPSGMTVLASPAPGVAGTGCNNFSADLLTDNTKPVFTFDMPAGSGTNPGVCTVTFYAMAPTGVASGTTRSNTIANGGVCDDGTQSVGAVCNTAASNTVTLTVKDVLTVAKSFSPNAAYEGTVSQATITISNLSANPVTAASFTDSLPSAGAGAQLVVANPANASSTCSGASVTANPGGTSFNVSGATIPARAANGTAGSCVVKVNVIGPAGNYTNIISANAITATQTYADGSPASVTNPVQGSGSLAYSSALDASKSFLPSIIAPGGKSTVTIHLSNTSSGAGAATLDNVSVTDPLPTNMTMASPSNAHTTCGGATSITAVGSSAALSGATIPSQGQCDFQFDVTGAGGANWVNAIPVGNITATGGVKKTTIVTSTLTNSSAGAVTVTVSSLPASLTAPGDTSVLTITLLNNGTLPLTHPGGYGLLYGRRNVRRCPDRNARRRYTQCGDHLSGRCGKRHAGRHQRGAWRCQPGKRRRCTLTVNVSMRTVGSIQNTIPVGAVTSAQGVSNTVFSQTTLSALASIGVTKQFIPDVVKPGQRARLRLTFINPMALPVASLAAVDNLPAGLVGLPAPTRPQPVLAQR